MATGIATIISFSFLVLALLILLPLRIRLDASSLDEEKNVFIYLGAWYGLSGLGISLLGDGVRFYIMLLGRRLYQFRPRKKRRVKEPKDVEPEKERPKEERPKKERPKKERPKKERPKKERPGPVERLKTMYGYLRIFKAPVLRFLRSSLRSLNLTRIDCNLEYGAGDPAFTGKAFGIYHSICPLLGEKVNVKVMPNFTDAVLRGDISVILDLKLYVLIIASLRLGISVGYAWLKDWLADRLPRKMWRHKDLSLSEG